MKHKIVLGLLFLTIAFQSNAQKASQPKVTIASVLKEMVDRDKISQFPESNYKTLQASTYNRESVSPNLPGWFADGDGLGFIRTEVINGKTEWVIMEDHGPGCIAKIWAVCFYYGLDNVTGANIKIYLDGNKEPVINTNFFNLVQGKDFIESPFGETSTRAGNLYFPIPYAKSCKITMDNKAFYNIINYRKYPKGTAVETFTMEQFNNTKALRSSVGKELVRPTNATGNAIEKTQTIAAGNTLTIDLPKGNNAVKQLEITIKNKENIPNLLRSVVLTANFDKEQTIWTPVGDFFNNVGKQQPYIMWEREVSKQGNMICRWVMPYQKEGTISLKNLANTSAEVSIKVITAPTAWKKNSMYFHATWRMDEPYPTFPLFDWNLIEAQGKGVIVGDEFTALNPSEGWWGEGDEKIYVDDDFKRNFPSHFGTGTEDYYGWAGGVVPTPKDEFSKPFLGNIIVGEQNAMGYNVCSRTRVLDAIPFEKRIKFDMEASCGTRSSWFFLQYTQTTFWYAIPGVKHNRLPLPEMAAKTLPTLQELKSKVESAKKKQYVVDGAVEAELYKVSSKSNNIIENLEEFSIWGEISNGKMLNLWFEKADDYAEFKITEQFEKSKLQMCTTVGPTCGAFDIYVNGIKKATQNFNTHHSGMVTPLIQLGECEPVDNAFTIRLVYTGKPTNAEGNRKQYGLGIDYLLIDNNFLKGRK